MAKEGLKDARSEKRSSEPSDAVQLLKADHRLVKNLFEQYHSALLNEKTPIAGRLFSELSTHAALEEGLFYPAVESMLEPADALESSVEGNGLDMLDLDEDEEIQDLEAAKINGAEMQDDEETGEEIISQAYETHQMMKALIGQLKMLDPQGSDYQEVFTELENTVFEHMVEEEDIIFPHRRVSIRCEEAGSRHAAETRRYVVLTDRVSFTSHVPIRENHEPALLSLPFKVCSAVS